VQDHLQDTSKRTPDTQADFRQVRSFYERLLEWKASLPTYFKEEHVPDWFEVPRATVIWKGLNRRMLLFKDFLFRYRNSHFTAKFANDDRARICLSVAAEAIESMNRFCSDLESICFGVELARDLFLVSGSTYSPHRRPRKPN
jgi:hypothetical protein